MDKTFPILAFLTLLVLAGCGGEPAEEAAPEPEPVVPLTGEELARVQELKEENICAECHGENLDGSETGPSLQNVAQYWTEDALVKYIYNPEFYMVSHQEVRQRNSGYEADMPAFIDMPEEDRRLLARWVLQQGE